MRCSIVSLPAKKDQVGSSHNSDDWGAETAKVRIATAQATLAMAMRLHAEVCSGRIRETIYQRKITIMTGGAGLNLPPDRRATRHDLHGGTFNLILIALGASALTLDETLELYFGEINPQLDPEMVGLRTMVNQLRNAFAHNPFRPRWLIRPHLVGKYSVKLGEEDRIEFDATRLDGVEVKPEDVGGLEGWIRVLQYCESIVDE
jgi:hypothetical protein